MISPHKYENNFILLLSRLLILQQHTFEEMEEIGQ